MWTRRAAAAGLVLVLGLAACASQGDDDTEVQAHVLEDDVALPLDADAGLVGISHYFDDDLELGSGQVVEAEPVTRHLVADALLDADDRVRCQLTLHAPADRGLTAEGELSATLVVEGRDGGIEELPVAALAVDLALEPGASHELRPTAPRALDRDEVRAVWCEPHYDPASG